MRAEVVGSQRQKGRPDTGTVERRNVVQAMETNVAEEGTAVGDPWTVGGGGLTVCGEAISGLLERNGVRGPEELSRLLGDVDFPMDAEEIRRQMSGEEELDPGLPTALEYALGTDLREDTGLTLAVAHGQMVCRVAQ